MIINFANINDINVGDELIADGGFTCMKEGQIGKVFLTENGELAISCDEERHLLCGQIDDETGTLVGLTKKV